jgi:hypothetical protein
MDDLREFRIIWDFDEVIRAQACADWLTSPLRGRPVPPKKPDDRSKPSPAADAQEAAGDGLIDPEA